MTQQKTLLRHLRINRELSLDLLQKKTGINVSTISRMERRLIPGTPAQVKALAKFFKVSEDAILADAQRVTEAA